jgi:rubrerythrin
MDLGSLFLILAVLIIVGVFISRPFFMKLAAKNAPQATSEREREHSTLLAEHERLLTALQELDFDHTLGKIPDEDYPTQREELLKAGAGVLRQLDNFEPQVSTLAAEDRLEAAIASRRADASARRKGQPQAAAVAAGPAVVVEDELEALIQSRRQARPEKAGGFCPRCGRPVQKSDQFCPKCGAKLA